jgi:hypothetical protein
MKPISMNSLFLPAVLMATLTAPSAASAQYRLPEVVAVVKADSLHAAAVILSQTMDRWGDAARLHRESAAIRSADDSLGFRCLRAAAQLSYGKGDLLNAQSSMTEAAAQAMARGDIVRAAHAYADAAWLANEQHRSSEVWTLARQAEVLAGSPLLSGEQRADILKRFVHVQADLAATTEH